MRECIQFGLLEPDGSQPAEPSGATRYRVHEITLAFAGKMLADPGRSRAGALGVMLADPEFEPKAKGRIGDYYRSLIARHVVRPEPGVPYWNSLVHDGMRAIDPEWPAIQQVFEWETRFDSRAVIELTKLLVHYMDSRFLNEARLDWVRQAIAALETGGPAEELALMKIDARSWTYIEEGKLRAAAREIEEGLQIAADCVQPHRNDLLALGKAWRARIALEEGDRPLAGRLIHEARSIASRPWIEMRVLMASGDIALRAGDAEGALAAYLKAHGLADSYGGEGNGYQTLPRIGFAYVETGRYAEAEETFRRLERTREIAIGRLYAAYGLATLAYKRGDPGQAQDIIGGITDKVPLENSTSLLSKMIGNLYNEMAGAAEKAARPVSATAAPAP